MRVAVVTTEGVPCHGTTSLWGDMFAFSARSVGLLALTLLHDPAILGAVPAPLTVAEVTLDSLAAGAGGCDLVVVPHPTGPSLPGALVDAINGGLPAILACPDAATLSTLRAASGIRRAGRLLSMNEEWVVGGRAFDYPQALRFERWHVPAGAEVLSTIGEWPDAVVVGTLAVTAADMFHAADLFRPVPSQHWPGGFHDVFPRHLAALVHAVLRLPQVAPARVYARQPTPAPRSDRPTHSDRQAEYDLRRDFHSFGFARFAVAELLRRLQPERLAAAGSDLERAGRVAQAAARRWCEGASLEDTETELGCAFGHLAAIVGSIAPVPRYLLDSLHGGVLLGDYGFAEYDSPRYVRDWFDLYTHWVDARGYRFSVEVGAGTIARMAERYPGHVTRMADYWRSGKIEVVNGTRAQPYPHLLPLASNARQFLLGQQALARAAGMRVRTYVSQEFGFTTQHPELLHGFGYDLACHRAQNWGRTPVERAPACLWESASGQAVLALAAAGDRSEKRIGTTYLDWPEMVAQAQRDQVPLLALTNLLDFFWMPAFREETIRANHYAPIFGRYATFRDMKPVLEYLDPAARRYRMDDYEADGFSRYPWAGGITGTMLRSLEAGNLLLEADLISCLARLTALAGGGYGPGPGSGPSSALGPAASDTGAAWEALADLENHDCFCVPHAEAGGHTSHYTSIVGPRRSITVLEAATAALDDALDDARRGRDAALERLGQGVAGDGGHVVVNASTRARRVCIPVSDRETVVADLRPLAACRARAVSTEVVADMLPYLENDALRLEISPSSGEVVLIGRLPAGDLARGALAGPGSRALMRAHVLAWGDHGQSRCVVEGLDVSRCALWQRARIRGRVLGRSGCPTVLTLTEIMLVRGSRRADFRTEVFPIRKDQPSYVKEGAPPEDQWRESLKVGFAPAGRLERLERLSQNVLEETRPIRFLSPAGLCATTGEGRFMIHTRALPHFARDGGSVWLVLWHAREERTTFEYAVELLAQDDLPVCRSLDYQRPPLLHRLSHPTAAPVPQEGSDRRRPPAPVEPEVHPWTDLGLELPAGLDVFGIIQAPQGVDLWCADISGHERTLTIGLDPIYRQAEASLLDGSNREPLPVTGGSVSIPVRAWGLFRLGLRWAEGEARTEAGGEAEGEASSDEGR